MKEEDSMWKKRKLPHSHCQRVPPTSITLSAPLQRSGQERFKKAFGDNSLVVRTKREDWWLHGFKNTFSEYAMTWQIRENDNFHLSSWLQCFWGIKQKEWDADLHPILSGVTAAGDPAVRNAEHVGQGGRHEGQLAEVLLQPPLQHLSHGGTWRHTGD